MNRSLTAYIIFLFLSISLNAQETYSIDSLTNMLNYHLPDTTRINLLNRLAEDHLYISHDEIIEYAQQALDLSDEINYEKGIAEAYNNLGTFYRVKGIYGKSIDYYFDALSIMEDIDDINGIARCYNLIGILYFYLSNFDLSLEYYSKALEINYQQNDKKWIAGNSNNVGMIYERKGQYDKALDYYLKSLEMNIELGYQNWIANNYGNIGSLYMVLNNPLSLHYFRQRLKINEQQNDTDGIAVSNFHVGHYYVSQDELQNAIPYLQKSYDLALTVNSLSTLKRSTEKLSEVYAGVEDFENAFHYEKIFKYYNDSLNLAANTEKIVRLQMQNQYMNELHLQELRQDRNSLFLILIALGLFFLFSFIVLIYNRQRSIAKKNRLEQKNLSLGNKLLIEELSFKDKLLQDNVQYLVHKNELLTHVFERLNEIKSSCKPETQKIVNEVIFELQSGIGNEFWEEFELRFKEIHSEFYSELNKQFPNLSANDKRLCAFLRLKMTTKEISTITHQSIKSIETARSRLRKKLNLQDPELSLNDFLNKI